MKRQKTEKKEREKQRKYINKQQNIIETNTISQKTEQNRSQ